MAQDITDIDPLSRPQSAGPDHYKRVNWLTNKMEWFENEPRIPPGVRTKAHVAAIEERRAYLRMKLAPTSKEELEGRLVKLFAGYPQAGAWTVGRTSLMFAACHELLGRYPAWALDEAIRFGFRHADRNTEFAPSAETLARGCDVAVAPWWAELDKLESLLRAKEVAPMEESDAERAEAVERLWTGPGGARTMDSEEQAKKAQLERDRAQLAKANADFLEVDRIYYGYRDDLKIGNELRRKLKAMGANIDVGDPKRRLLLSAHERESPPPDDERA
jgi:hypothetical protein